MDDNKALKTVILGMISCITLLFIICTTVHHIKIPFTLIFLWGVITPFIADLIAKYLDETQ